MILHRLRCGVPHIVGALGCHRLADLGQDHHLVSFAGTQVAQVQRYAKILAHVEGTGQQ
ncbi:hypothetical protein D3C77_699190 [compost metagenome]